MKQYRFIFIRDSEALFWLAPYRRGMNEKQILRAIVTTISPIADDYLWQYRDEDGKEMSYSASLVRLVEYANVHHKFWELVEGGLFDTRELVKLCKAGPTMEDAFRLGAKGLRWKELVDA